MSKLTLCVNCRGTKKTSSMGYVQSKCPACHGIGMVEVRETNHLARTEEKANGEVIGKGKNQESQSSKPTGREEKKGKKVRKA